MVFSPIVKSELDALQRQEARIAAKRALEAARRANIFDPKIRTIGVDVKALNDQVLEKKHTAQIEQERNMFFDQQSIDISKQLVQLSRIKQRKIKERDVQVQNFRESHQKRAETRDYDLQDPFLVHNQKPPRQGDIVKLPMSSLQMFSGEDLSKSQRVRTQQNELTQWANQAIEQKEQQEARRKASEQDYANQIMMIDEEMARLQTAKQTNVKTANVINRHYNQGLHEDVAKRRAADKARQAHDEHEEMEHNRQSTWLNEEFSTTIRQDKPQLYTSSKHAYIPWNFKGYSVAERQSILNEQANQIARKEQDYKKAQEKEKADDNQRAEVHRQLMLAARIKNRNQVAERLHVREVQEQQKLEFNERYDYINKELYTNHVDDYIFNCFGTTTR